MAQTLFRFLHAFQQPSSGLSSICAAVRDCATQKSFAWSKIHYHDVGSKTRAKTDLLLQVLVW